MHLVDNYAPQSAFIDNVITPYLVVNPKSLMSLTYDIGHVFLNDRCQSIKINIMVEYESFVPLVAREIL